MKGRLGSLQKLGRALMTPVAVMPAAALLLRLGAEDVLNVPVIMAGGKAIFDNLPLVFALGVSMGLAGGAGAAALAGGVGYYVAAHLYNKYKDIKLPDFRGFFGGKRFVPITRVRIFRRSDRLRIKLRSCHTPPDAYSHRRSAQTGRGDGCNETGRRKPAGSRRYRSGNNCGGNKEIAVI
ncbi:phosphotransferase system EIIC protein [Thermosediminibacter litoriperuensis]|uniref:Phosphotransferase system EIIC protein n=1 Tax=Thermosediminibacter litoriperuensis TaxID=291989 RepID=A0A5S5AR82_9FIRM|nr:PTS transporter subunit EIIC [Thermosediminibacter litoriperuensis]TYP54204.1 phosphotransferase system EIIC protein [Thermosediminibacter litoriperuensis]